MCSAVRVTFERSSPHQWLSELIKSKAYLVAKERQRIACEESNSLLVSSGEVGRSGSASPVELSMDVLIFVTMNEECWREI